MDLRLKKVETSEQLEAILKVRREVFIKEQNVSEEEEIDKYDDLTCDNAIHFMLSLDNKVIATLRILSGTEYIKIGRVAVLKEYRGQGYGKYLVAKTMRKMKEEDIFNAFKKPFYLEAQIQVIGFYNKLGFKEYGDIFLDANIEHKKMKEIKH